MSIERYEKVKNTFDWRGPDVKSKVNRVFKEDWAGINAVGGKL
jgi:hypothetical protein